MELEQRLTLLTHKFMEMINEAEYLFGEREKQWYFVGIEFKEDGPYIMYYPNHKISIVLSNGCSHNFVAFPQLYYQLSHETCHLLYPTGKADANVLNEGISTYFSKIFLEKEFPNSKYAIEEIQKSSYFEAYSLVEKLINYDSDAIKKIRKISPNISEVSKDQLLSLELGLEIHEIEKLIEKFKYT